VWQTDRETDRQTDRQTDRHMLWQKQTEFIICSMLYAKAKGQIITLTTCYHYYYKIKLESLSLSCKSHRAKTAHIKILSANSTKGQEGQTASTCQISWRSIKPLRRYGDFSIFFQRWRPSAIVDLWCTCSDHPRRALGGLYHFAKFGWNRCGSFDNMQVLIFWELGLKQNVY